MEKELYLRILESFSLYTRFPCQIPCLSSSFSLLSPTPVLSLVLFFLALGVGHGVGAARARARSLVSLAFWEGASAKSYWQPHFALRRSNTHRQAHVCVCVCVCVCKILFLLLFFSFFCVVFILILPKQTPPLDCCQPRCRQSARLNPLG